MDQQQYSDVPDGYKVLSGAPPPPAYSDIPDGYKVLGSPTLPTPQGSPAPPSAQAAPVPDMSQVPGAVPGTPSPTQVPKPTVAMQPEESTPRESTSQILETSRRGFTPEMAASGPGRAAFEVSKMTVPELAVPIGAATATQGVSELARSGAIPPPASRGPAATLPTEQQRHEAMSGIAKTVGGAMQATAPFVAPAGIFNAPARSAITLLAATGVSEAAKTVAKKAGLSSEAQELVGVLPYFIPYEEAIRLGIDPKIAVASSVEGTAVHAGIKGAKGSVAVTPDEIILRGGVLGKEGEIRIPRNGAKPKSPALEPPTIEGGPVKYSDVPEGYEILPPEKPVHHTSNDVEDLRASAERQSEKIGDAVAKATEGVEGAKVEAVRDAKDSDRITDKAERQGVQPSQIGDIAGAKVTVPHQEAANQVLENLHKEMPVESVNGTVTGEPGKNNVRQTQAIVSTGAGENEPIKKAEVMIQTPEMAEATERTHDDYRQAQELRAAGKEAEAGQLEAKIARDHEAAEQAARARQGESNAVQKPSAAEVHGSPQGQTEEAGSQPRRVGEVDRLQETPAQSAQAAGEKEPAIARKPGQAPIPPQPRGVENLKDQTVEIRDPKNGEWKPGTILADATTPNWTGGQTIRRLRGVYDDGGKFNNVDIKDVRKSQEGQIIPPGRQGKAIIDKNAKIPTDAMSVLNRRIWQATGVEVPEKFWDGMTPAKFISGLGKLGLDDEVLMESNGALHDLGYRQFGDYRIGRDGLQKPEAEPDIGVDFDGTLFTENSDGTIGTPIPERIASLKKMLADGKNVIIESRRASHPDEVKKIQDALEAAGVPRLPVTDQKVAPVLIDDSAHHVESNQNTPLPQVGGANEVKGEEAKNAVQPSPVSAEPAQAADRTAGMSPTGTSSERRGLSERRSEKQPTANERREGERRVSQMTHSELQRAALEDYKSGGAFLNERAWKEREPQPHMAITDVDGLGAVNDKFGHEVGDALIKAYGEAFRRAGIKAYRIGGDEVMTQGASPEELRGLLEKAREHLKGTEIDFEKNGESHILSGVDFSYGIGSDEKSADTALYQHKRDREASGDRAQKGHLGRNVVVAKRDQADELPDTVSGGQEVSKKTAEENSTTAKEKPDRKGERGSATPAAINPFELAKAVKASWSDLVEKFISGTLKIGDKYYEVAKADPEIAHALHLIDNKPMDMTRHAQANVSKVTKGLDDSQIRLASMMADSDSRDFLKEHKPDEYKEAMQDPKVMAAVSNFDPLWKELTKDRESLGWPVRTNLHIEQDASTDRPFAVKDRQGKIVESFGSEAEAMRHISDHAEPEPHLKRTYPEHSRSPLPAETGTGPYTGSYPHEKGLRPPRMDKKQREMSAQYFYDHGRKDFSGYVESYKQTKEAIAKQELFNDFTKRATPWTVGTAQPSKITYNGKEYVRPDIALKAKKGKSDLPAYGIYDPTRGEKFSVKPGINPSDRWLGPKQVVDAMESYDKSRGGDSGPLRKFFQEQIVGLFGPAVHVNNILRRVGQTAGMGTFDPRSWPSIARVIASPDLRARLAKGVDDATIAMLSREGAWVDWNDIGNQNAYIGGNFNPSNWIRSFGKGVLFDPKFAKGWGGLDPKARVIVADYFKDHYPEMSDQQIAAAVNDGLGNYNRANWTERQRFLAKFTLFPGWDSASVKWFLRKPFVVGVAGSLAVLAINQALKALGQNSGDDSTDLSYVHIGDRKISSGLISDNMGKHLMAPVLGALQAKIRGDDVGAGAVEEGMRGSSALAGTLAGPVVEMVADQVYNRKYAGGAAELVKPEDKYKPGTWAPNVEWEKRIAFASLKGSPALSRFIDNQGHWDWAQGLGGAVLGVTNYKYGAEERFKANVGKAAIYGQTLKQLADQDPDAASEFVKDPIKATYLMFHDDLESMSRDLKELDAQIERVRSADLPASERQQALEDLKSNRNELLKAADGLNDALMDAKSRSRNEQTSYLQRAAQ